MLVAKAKAHCAIRSDVITNHASFYPKLRPCFAELVPRYTQAAQQAGARVHDGAAWVKDILLRDHMHFAPESTPAVVDMYFSAVEEMLSQPPGRAPARSPEPGDTDETLSQRSEDPPDLPVTLIERAPEQPLQSAEEVRVWLLDMFRQRKEAGQTSQHSLDLGECAVVAAHSSPTRAACAATSSKRAGIRMRFLRTGGHLLVCAA